MILSEEGMLYVPAKVSWGAKFYFLKEISKEGDVIYDEDLSHKVVPTSFH